MHCCNSNDNISTGNSMHIIFQNFQVQYKLSTLGQVDLTFLKQKIIIVNDNVMHQNYTKYLKVVIHLNTC